MFFQCNDGPDTIQVDNRQSNQSETIYLQGNWSQQNFDHNEDPRPNQQFVAARGNRRIIHDCDVRNSSKAKDFAWKNREENGLKVAEPRHAEGASHLNLPAVRARENRRVVREEPSRGNEEGKKGHRRLRKRDKKINGQVFAPRAPEQEKMNLRLAPGVFHNDNTDSPKKREKSVNQLFNGLTPGAFQVSHSEPSKKHGLE